MKCVLAAIVSGSFLAAVAVGQQTDNRGIHAVPAPKRVVIDGKLDEWDLSGRILICYDLASLRDVYSGEVAMMYDDENLYVGIHWKDPVPMGNSHHPRFMSHRGWAGDCVQLRLRTDRITHATMWYHAESGEPMINLDYGKSMTEPFGGGSTNLFRVEGWKLMGGAEMAFLKDADGRGYVQEIKLPWRLFTLEKKYKAGDSFQCGIELLWGEGDWPVHRYADNLDESANNREFFWTAVKAWGKVQLEPKGNLKLPEPPYMKALKAEGPDGPVEISYEIPKDARVTVAINSTDGRRIRNLIAAQPRQKGRNFERWDGLDDDGKPVPPGTYVMKGIYHDGIHVNWMFSFANPGNPTWETPDGKGAFYADHTSPRAAAAGGGLVALSCPMGEAGKNIIVCDLEGQRQWGAHSRLYGINVALALGDQWLYVADVEPVKGDWSRGKTFIWRCEAKNGKYAPWERRDEQGQPILDLVIVPEGPADECRAISWRDGRLAVLLGSQRKLVILDGKTGDLLQEIGNLPEGIAGGCWSPDGTFVIAAGGRLFRWDTAKSAGTEIASGLNGAYGVACDSEGFIYVSVREPDHQVKVFDPSGKPASEIGRKGGRPNHGRFDDLAMRNPGRIAVDSNGRIWVPEENNNPKRTSVWERNGKFVRDFVGTTSYAGAGAINPYDPGMGFSDNTVYKLDIETGSWRPVYSLGSRGDPADIFPCYVDSRIRCVVAEGRTYVYATDTARGAGEVHVMICDKGEWRSVAHIGRVPGPKEARVEQWKKYEHPVFRDHDGQAYIWCDRNGDALVQPEEMEFGSLPARSYYWGQLPSPDGTVFYPGEDGQSVVRLPIVGWTACGAPEYRISAAVVVPFRNKIGPGGSGEGMIMGGSGGRVYMNRSPLVIVGPDGEILGTYPSRHVSVHGSHTAGAARPGYLIGPSSVLGTADFGGEIGEVFDLNGNLGENYLFTWDGLWIQSLFKDVRGGFETPVQAVRGMPFDATTAGGESFGGNFCRTADGRVWLVTGGTDARVLQVSGLDTIRRFEGRLEYTAEQFAEAERFVRRRAAETAPKREYILARASVAAVIDGKADEWRILDDSAGMAEIAEGTGQRFGRVEARYDEKNLYVAWRVWAPAGRIRNSGQDFRMLFKTGDAVDLMLGPAESRSGEGNLRLLISAMEDQPVAVLYRKIVPGTAEKDRIPFSSPWRTICFDRVERQADVQVAAGALPGGYFVEAAVPWKVLGIQPVGGLKLRGDFGVLSADKDGTMTVSRKYWSNRSTGLVNDVPGEADLAPELWGTLVLE